jgi:hypothetical protein
MEYKVAYTIQEDVASALINLKRRVEDAMSTGFKPQGGVTINHLANGDVEAYQALIKEGLS